METSVLDTREVGPVIAGNRAQKVLF